jgi:hypothetical protein
MEIIQLYFIILYNFNYDINDFYHDDEDDYSPAPDHHYPYGTVLSA